MNVNQDSILTNNHVYVKNALPIVMNARMVRIRHVSHVQVANICQVMKTGQDIVVIQLVELVMVPLLEIALHVGIRSG